MSGGERPSASRMTVEEAVRQVRREVRQLRATRTILEQVQAALVAPSPEELTGMEKGERPLSAEAYLLGVLKAAIAELENFENDLRMNVSAWSLSLLERAWRQEILPDKQDLQRIRAVLSERERLRQGGIST